ncbi:phage major capsid protein [Streptococcus constellatus]|uniref:phage major capsid protein n=1 Tax=Streptococcus constellatus TaxID=76860 RepID=UPI0028EA6C86|nr:phage major capsid protein [Streptococcus constellatus]
MTINITKLPRYQEAVTKFTEAVTNGAEAEQRNELYADAMGIMGEELLEVVSDASKKEAEELFNNFQKNPKLTANEIKFFNEINKEVGSKNGILIPEETYNQVFDELTTEHPLLSIINFKNAGMRLKALTVKSETGTAVWGNVFGEILGQLDATFQETAFEQNKLTAFVVIPKDALKFGATWLKQFVMEQIKEAMSVALETAIVKGNGDKQPIGLIKDLANGTVQSEKIVYNTDKTALASLATLDPTNAPKLLAPVMKALSISDKGNRLNIAGQTYLLVNPADYYDLVAKFTSMNLNGVYTTTLPFGVQLAESKAVDTGKAIAFVANRYDAYIGGGVALEEFDQTLAIQDMQLVTAKSYWYGKTKDNHTAALLTLAGG